MPVPVDTLHFGLGPIGLGILTTGLAQGGIRPRCAVDVDIHRTTQALASLGQNLPIGRTLDALAPEQRRLATVAVHATSARAAQVKDQILALVEAGLGVVSTSEELAFPSGANRPIGAAIDAAARARGVAVIAAGVNPGMVMDSLVVHLSSVMTRLQRIVVERVVDTGTRRLPLQRKTGAGLTVEAFEEGTSSGAIGHVGLRESAEMIARAVGWELDRVEERIEPVVPDGSGDGANVLVRGLRQTARGVVAGEERISLHLLMATGARDPHDRIELDGDPPLRLLIPGGVAGDVATAGVVLNLVQRVRHWPPGFHTVADVPDAGALAAGMWAEPRAALTP